eukprot:m.1183882 g.1183882  ORF g.1183882 m.1183882 type:complete len:88 (-) comp24540_c1_seq88:1567-1830(-)
MERSLVLVVSTLPLLEFLAVSHTDFNDKYCCPCKMHMDQEYFLFFMAISLVLTTQSCLTSIMSPHISRLPSTGSRWFKNKYMLQLLL